MSAIILHQLDRLAEDERVLAALDARAEWAVLRPSEMAAIVLAARQSPVDRESGLPLLDSHRVAARRNIIEVFERNKFTPPDERRADELLLRIRDKLFQDARVLVNIGLHARFGDEPGQSQTVLDRFLADHTFKTVWQTGRAQVSTQARQGPVAEMLGHVWAVGRHGEDTGTGPQFTPRDPDSLPKFGSLGFPLLEREGTMRGAGPFVAVLKPHVRERATLTGADSLLLGTTKADEFRTATWEAIITALPHVEHDRMAMLLGLAQEPQFARFVEVEDPLYSVFEAQMYGPVTLADVEEWIITWQLVTPRALMRAEMMSKSKPRKIELLDHDTALRMKTRLEEVAAEHGYDYHVILRQKDVPSASRWHGHERGPFTDPGLPRDKAVADLRVAGLLPDADEFYGAERELVDYTAWLISTRKQSDEFIAELFHQSRRLLARRGLVPKVATAPLSAEQLKQVRRVALALFGSRKLESGSRRAIPVPRSIPRFQLVVRLCRRAEGGGELCPSGARRSASPTGLGLGRDRAD
ncbi:hypothetical protein [Lentzea sp. NPDC004782]|uniref:hypothetical protein n=1 Tax=Lentzea sp. NPDC004782 TaxID=3154458 RepID=UPI0033A009A9